VWGRRVIGKASDFVSKSSHDRNPVGEYFCPVIIFFMSQYSVPVRDEVSDHHLCDSDGGIDL